MIDPIFNQEEVSNHWATFPVWGALVTQKQRLFEATKDSQSDIRLNATFAEKMTLEGSFDFKKEKIYRIISPVAFKNLEWFRLMILSKEIAGSQMDYQGQNFSTYENTLNSILVQFKRDIVVDTIILWLDDDHVVPL